MALVPDPQSSSTHPCRTSENVDVDRRAFLDLAFCAAVLGGFACPRFLRSARETLGPNPSLPDEGQEKSGMTYEEVFNFAYRDWVIPLAKEMAMDMGEDAYLDLMRSASSRAAREQGAYVARQLSGNEFQAFVHRLKAAEGVFGNTQTFEVVEETDRYIQVRFTECLCARVFREADAAEIGYAMMCHPDAAFAEGFNSNLRMTRSKTLMEGDDYCDHRWYMTG